MGIISRSSGAPYADGEVLPGAELESDFANIYNEFNGNVEAANIKDGTITTSKLAALSITQTSLADGAASGTEAQSNTAPVNLTTAYANVGNAISHAVGNPARHVVIMVSASIITAPVTHIVTVKILKDGSLMANTGEDTVSSTAGGYLFNRTWIDLAPTPGGTHVYTVQARADSASGVSIAYPTLFAFEPRR